MGSILRRFGPLTALFAVGGIVVALSVFGGNASADGNGPVHVLRPWDGKPHAASGSNNLSYRGGAADGAAGTVGVEANPGVYIVFWGSQWNNNDPSGEAVYLQHFLGGLYGGSDTWSTSTTQYCQGIASGTSSCSGGQMIGHGSSTPVLGVWFDNGSAAPNKPRQSQIASEAAKAAGHFGNTTASKNASVQYVVATAHGFNASGFGTSYCAWHSSTTSSAGLIAYTNLPYITDAGASCGKNFVNSGTAGLLDGVSVVAGHEYAETVTDQFPSNGWLDNGGAENGDKCAWITSGQGAGADISLSTGSFAVQSLWSNATSNCVISYP